MPGTKGSFLNYREDAMMAAVEDVRLHKTAIRTAAKKFGVPRTTLKYKVEGKSPIHRKMGPPSILSQEEEAEICRWVKKMALAGFPVTVNELCISVEKFVRDAGRPNPFKDGKPGRTWINKFLRRNPTISRRISQNLTVSRAGITSDNILNWFSEVHSYLKEQNYDTILDDPSRLFNCDETAFFLNPKGPKVLAKKGDKTVYQQVNADEKECVTVLVTGSAGGNIAPTTVLFKYKRIPQDIADNFPHEWGLGKTDSGWMTCEAFFEFIADIFYPWLVRTQVTLPIILFVDGHVSHLSLQTSQFCESKGIILVALYPNATHLMQPMDVAVFKSLKEGWKEKIHQWRVDNILQEQPTLLKKKDFAKLLQDVIKENVTESVLSNAFRKCGLHPWNPQAIEVPGKVSKEKNDNESAQLRVKYLKGGLSFLNEIIDADKLNAFQLSSETWSGNPLDTSLFNLWKTVKTELQELTSTTEQCTRGNTLPGTKCSDLATPSTISGTSTAQTEFLDGENISAEVGDNALEFHLGETTLIEQLIVNEATPPEFELLNCLPTELTADNGPLPTTDQAMSSTKEVSAPPKINFTSESETPLSLLINKNTPHIVMHHQSEENVQEFSAAGPSHGIPSPFKKHFFYPATKNTNKKRVVKERMPSVVSGKLCQEYFKKKIKKKEDMERLKAERAARRQQNKEEKERLKKGKVEQHKPKRVKRVVNFSSESSDSSVEISSGESVLDDTSGNEDSDNHNWQPLVKSINEHVIFKYEGQYYPGQIISVTDDSATVSSMVKCGRLWKWPERPDILDYQWRFLVSHINEPIKVSKTRNVYSVPELDFLWNY